MPPKILVVDDDKDILEVVRIILSSNGFEPVLIDNGDNLLNKIKEIKPAVILLDSLLRGGIDGVTLCKKIKRDKEYANIAIIIFSAHAYTTEQLDEYLCDDYIEKPFDIADLVEKVTYNTKRHNDKNSGE